MCGRFALTLPKDAAIQLFAARDGLGDDPLGQATPEGPRYNIRPTQPIWVVAAAEPPADDPLLENAPTQNAPRQNAPPQNAPPQNAPPQNAPPQNAPDQEATKHEATNHEATIRNAPPIDRRVLRAMRWGFIPHWAKGPNDGPLLINARGETLADKPAFKKSALHRRCLVPADGFYEWRADAGRGKEPHWIHPRDRAPIAFAGVWRVWRGVLNDGEAVEIPSVAIVTCAANDALAPLHERTPVVIPPERFGLWLGEEGKGAARLLAAAADDFFAHHPVSTRINKGGRAAPDDPGLIAPADAPPAETPEPPRIGDLFS